MKYPNKPTKQPPQKLELLETFRGIAALLIVAFHATELFSLKFDRPFLLSIFEFGDSGVDFFFVLSGFFLGISTIKLIGRQNAASNFLTKRCVRIYPLYWLVSLCIIPVYFLVPSFGKGHEQTIGVILKSLLLIPQDHAPILSVAWFLSHLLFFYLAFTAVILLPKVASKIILVGLSVSAAFMFADIFSAFQFRNSTHFLLNFIFSYYNFEFVAGWGLGIFFSKNQLNPVVSLSILSIGCLSFIAAGLLDVYVFQTSTNISGVSDYYEFVAYGLSSLLIVGGAAFLEQACKLSINKEITNLGSASFAIYLTHYPILSIFTKVIQITKINSIGFYTITMTLACVAAVLVGCLVHFSIEKKLTLVFKNRLAHKQT